MTWKYNGKSKSDERTNDKKVDRDPKLQEKPKAEGTLAADQRSVAGRKR